MRFEGSRTFDVPADALWFALRDPAVLEQLIPNCSRLERQPGYTPDREGDFSIGFEVGHPDSETGAEPIIGWLEVDRQSPYRHVGIVLTLNDALAFLRAEGMIHLHSRENGQVTDLHYAIDVKFPGQRGVAWSAQAHAQAEATITEMLNRLSVIAVPVAATLGSGSGKAPAKPDGIPTTGYRSANHLPSVEVPATTQAMLRRLAARRERETWRTRRLIAIGVVGGLAAVGVVAELVLWIMRRQQTTNV